jgi:galactokinase
MNGEVTAVKSYAPGRAEWLGNHTDYNDGLVIGIGLEVGASVTALALSGNRLVVHASDLGETSESDLADLRPCEPGSWANYVIGVAAGFVERGAKPGGLELDIRSSVPVGAGLSSSAALECATARALQRAWGTDFDDMELARIGQKAEHKFAGVRCGLLDQVTSLFAARDQAVFLDCRSLEVRRVPVPPDARFVIVQSGVKHALSDGAYNERRAECEEAAEILGVSKLREATPEMLDAAEREGKLRSAPLRRARHVVDENSRVAAAVGALERRDLSEVGRLMNESHESSRTLFENSCEELDFLCNAAREIPGCLGARLTGGGFGGAILALAAVEDAENFAAALAVRARSSWGTLPQMLVTAAGGGDPGGGV